MSKEYSEYQDEFDELLAESMGITVEELREDVEDFNIGAPTEGFFTRTTDDRAVFGTFVEVAGYVLRFEDVTIAVTENDD